MVNFKDQIKLNKFKKKSVHINKIQYNQISIMVKPMNAAKNDNII